MTTDTLADALAELPFQTRVHGWIIACFGAAIGADKVERNHRFIEEALELVQSTGCTQGEAHQLVDYVYGRPVGDPFQEVGGVMNTLAALCTANGLYMAEAGEAELARVWTKVEKIRAKQAAKPKHSPLPEAVLSGDLMPRSEHLAALAAANEAAADAVIAACPTGIDAADVIEIYHDIAATLRALTPADATAALERVVQKAREELLDAAKAYVFECDCYDEETPTAMAAWRSARERLNAAIKKAEASNG